VPALYCSGLLQQEDYCITIIQTNINIEKNDEFIVEECSCLDIDELFIRAKE